MRKLHLIIERGQRGAALFSDCRSFRYALWRLPDDGRGTCLFVMLNPSTADASQDDPTIRRCIAYAKRWRYGEPVIANAFAWRSTDPSVLRELGDTAIGVYNDQVIALLGKLSAIAVCGWGAHGAIGDRGVGVLRALERHQVRPHALSLTAKGHPGHPLYLRGDLEPFPIEAADPAAGAKVAAIRTSPPG